jgi:exodeoxyribonuclease VII large subunit
MWRRAANRVRFDLHDGLKVNCRGSIGVYPPHGKYQLMIEEIQPKGIGALELALRQLREKLDREGLFDPQRKRPLPKFARRVAVVTSPTGAAIRDFLEVLRRRWRGVDVLIVPVRVQGEGAAQEIAAGIRLVNRMAAPPDCLIVTRGGGSLEDLWAFNEELVCRAIYGSRLPVVSAVGHEIDVTLSDLVADVRALTPSEAAELVAPSAEELVRQLRQYQSRLGSALRSRAASARSRLEALTAHRMFRKPYELVQELSQRLDDLESRAYRAVGSRIRAAEQETGTLAARLDSLSPLAVLRRGYSVTERVVDGKVVGSTEDLTVGQQIRTRLASGQVFSRVEDLRGDGTA